MMKPVFDQKILGLTSMNWTYKLAKVPSGSTATIEDF